MYKLNSEKMFYDDADGIAVVINFTTGVYYGFNQFGTAILNGLTEGAGNIEIANAAKQLNGCPDNIEEIVSDFVDSLLAKEILLKDSEEEKAVTLSEESVKEGFVPEIEEYSEVQDLILADPIHEVDPDKGWPMLK